MLLNKSITLADIEAVDPDLHQSLTWMLNNCIEIRENGQGNLISIIIWKYLVLNSYFNVNDSMMSNSNLFFQMK